MDLKCRLGHMWNGVVLVNGTEYKIDENGIAAGLSDEDAQLLLQNPEGWDTNTTVRKPKSPVQPEAPKATEVTPSAPMETAAKTTPPGTSESPPASEGEGFARRKRGY